MKQKLETMETQAKQDIAAADSLPRLEDLRVRYLGRKGELTEVLRGLSELPIEQRKELGRVSNEMKERLTQVVEERKTQLEVIEAQKRATEQKVDLTLPGRRPRRGHAHPVSEVIEEILAIFSSLGFQVAWGPDIETEYYNFDCLNTPPDHPARDLHDTFFVKPGVVLRTHMSPVQMRVMEKTTPPVAIVAPGRTYRVDADASHSPMFHQVEGLLVDEAVSFAELKGTLMYFIHKFFGPDTKIRFRPHFFPFTEPSAEVDISCSMCGGSGCRVCKHSGWLEILGCGMLHPEVFRHANYDSEKYTGFAFGMGVDRIAMLRHGITSIHHLFENDLRFLEQF